MKKTLLLLTLLTTITIAKNNVEIIHGHTLPPEPAPVLNNATLGGVDSNNNGVRDDVERAIYKKYDKKLHAVFMMDKAKFYQRTLVEPTASAKIIQKDATKTIDCRTYLARYDESFRLRTFKKDKKFVKNLTFNNSNRVQKYLDYNIALSGGIYGSEYNDIALKSCSQEVKDAFQEMGQ